MSRPQAEKDSKGVNIITKPFLKKLCEFNQAYETPKLNTHLYLHYMGFTEIQNLEDYINLRALWLENNLISEIKNLSCLKKLRFLYLQNNAITQIENLDDLTELTALNLSHNQITLIENLSGLSKLEDLDISHNKLQFSYSLKGIKDVPSLKALDLRENLISDSEFLLETLKSLPELRCLVLIGNKCIKNIANYRKVFVSELKKLNFLDEKMIPEIERLACDAWLVGGKDAELEVRKKYTQAREEAEKKGLEEFGAYEKLGMEKVQEKRRKIETEREEEKKIIQEERKKFGFDEEKIKELNEREEKLSEPIRDSDLVEFYLKPGKIVYQSGEFDSYGNPVVKEKHVAILKDLSELKVQVLEELLVLNEFDFEAVWEVLSNDYNCSIESLRQYWWEYSNSLETFEELE